MDDDVIGKEEIPFEWGTKENGSYPGVGGITGVGVTTELVLGGGEFR